MSAYVAGFDYDVFISYSHVDNLPLGINTDEPGWVEALVKTLSIYMARKLGRKEFVHIWFDGRIAPNLSFSDEIKQAVSRATLLVPVVSEGYLASDWCRKERELFIEANRQRGIQGRIIPVYMTDLDHSRLPATLQELLGVRFFKKASEDGPSRTFGMPMVDPKDRYYFERVDDLSHNISKTLRKLKTESTDPKKPPLQEDPGQAVFLAEVTADLEDDRDNIRRHLEQIGVTVLPDRYYERTPQAYRNAMEKDLRRTSIFVQLLGQFVTPKTPDVPNGYEGLQLDLAQAAQLPILRWHHQNLDPESVKDPELLGRETVMVMGFEDFKREVEKRLRQVAAKREVPQTGNGGYVLVDCKSSDINHADSIAEILDDKHVGYYIMEENHPLTDLVSEDDYDALLVIYGACDADWVHQQIRQCRQIMLRKRKRPPVCGVFLAPCDRRGPLRIKPPKFYFFEDVTHPIFNAFLTAVQERTALYDQP